MGEISETFIVHFRYCLEISVESILVGISSSNSKDGKMSTISKKTISSMAEQISV